LEISLKRPSSGTSACDFLVNVDFQAKMIKLSTRLIVEFERRGPEARVSTVQQYSTALEWTIPRSEEMPKPVTARPAGLGYGRVSSASHQRFLRSGLTRFGSVQ